MIKIGHMEKWIANEKSPLKTRKKRGENAKDRENQLLNNSITRGIVPPNEQNGLPINYSEIRGFVADKQRKNSVKTVKEQ